MKSRLFLGGVILAITFFIGLHGLATHADYVAYSLIGVPVAALVMGYKIENVSDNWNVWDGSGLAGLDNNPSTSGVDDWRN